MTIFEEKINNYLVEANKMLKNTKSRKLSSLFYNDISVLLTVIYNNGLDVDVDSIFKRTDLYFDSSDHDDKFVDYFLKAYIECMKVNNRVGDLGPYFYNKYGEGYFKEFKTLMNIEDSVDLCHRFFEFYDKDLSDYFNHILKNKNLAIGGYSWNDSTAGCTFSLLSQNEPFIIVNKFNNVYLPYVITHEVIHDYLKNPERSKDNITNLSLNTKNHDKLFLLNNYGLKEDNLGKSRVLSKHMKEHFKY